ncbi:MAG: hypothetical protein LBD84_03445 [Campylobacteraceae bacterium]|jgi:hypothetical protein|nr:hypothetical protein [Campylobacteraceae bacterium]
MKQKILLFAIFIVIATAGIFAVFSDKIYSYFERDITFKDVQSDCDLHANFCEVIFENGKSIKLDVSRPVKAAEKFILTVYTSDFNDSELEAVIYGVNMNMGVFNHTLEKIQDGIYAGVSILPACMGGKMTWRVNIISQKENIGASFILELS